MHSKTFPSVIHKWLHVIVLFRIVKVILEVVKSNLESVNCNSENVVCNSEITLSNYLQLICFLKVNIN